MMASTILWCRPTVLTDQVTSDNGQVYVIFGSDSAFSATFDPSTLNGTNGFTVTGVGGSDSLGTWVFGGGDFNGDGIEDLMMAANSL